MTSEYPRSKASELQGAKNELEYWRAKMFSLRSATVRLMEDDKVAAKQVMTWQARVEMLEAQVKARRGEEKAL